LFRRTQRPEADAIEVIIGPRATFSGTLQCDASIRVDGAVDQGRLVTPANVILTETANVQCDIIAKTVSIRGQFNGVIQADRVEMLDGSQVQGVLNVNSFYMDERAVLRAAVNIRGDAAGMVQRPQPPQQPSIPVVPPLPAPNAAQAAGHNPAQNTVHNTLHNTTQTMPGRGVDEQ
jgi:cytoskeletal protein CcmA (bactofilin family)